MAIRFGLGERSISDACFSVSSARTWFLFGDLVGRCGIMRHIDVLTCRIDTIEWLFSSELGGRAVVFFFFLVLLLCRWQTMTVPSEGMMLFSDGGCVSR